MATTTSNSQSVTLGAGTASALNWSQFFETIVVNNGTAAPVYFTTDGVTVATVSGVGCDVVGAGQTAVVANRIRRPVPNQSAPGSTSVSLISTPGGLVQVAPQ